MAAAALVEIRRLSVARAERGTATTLSISSFYLLLQFLLVGTGNVFIYVGHWAARIFLNSIAYRNESNWHWPLPDNNLFGFIWKQHFSLDIKEIYQWASYGINDGRLD